MRLIMVPSEKPASTRPMIDWLVSVGVFSNFRPAPFSSAGGLRMRTVAFPEVLREPSFEPLVPLPRVSFLVPARSPKISSPPESSVGLLARVIAI